MAVSSTGYPLPGTTRDWSTEITPGFAYGGDGRAMADGSARVSASGGGMNSGGMSAGSGMSNSGAVNSGSGMADSGGTGSSGNMAGSITTGRWTESRSNAARLAASAAGNAGWNSSTGGGLAGTNRENDWENAAAAPAGMTGTADSGGSSLGGTGGAAVRAGWYPGGGYMDIIGRDIENNLPASEIGAPDSLEEVFRGSMKALLLRNIGNYVVATFLIGTQGTVSWEGILYDVGNDYLAIYQTGRDQYIVSDLYSLKYVEFYDTRRREMCEALMNGQAGN